MKDMERMEIDGEEMERYATQRNGFMTHVEFLVVLFMCVSEY